MFHRLINNNVKINGIRKFSNNNNNHIIVEELTLIRNALQAIAVSLCGLNLIVGFKR